MATIQIRNLPEETYEIIRKRAREQGQSIQTYMRERLIEDAKTPKPEDIWDNIDQLRAQEPTPDATSVVPELRALRDA